jgi:hypothetical protein
MWMLLSRRLRYTLLVVLVVILAAIYVGIAFHENVPPDLRGKVIRISFSTFSAIGTAAFLVTVLGDRLFLWRLPLRLRMVKNYLKFPDVNGVWIGPRYSSYLENEAKAAGEPAPSPRDMQLSIRQSWLNVEVKTISPDRLTRSKSVNAFPHLSRVSPVIWSVYEATVEGATETEREFHNGCALLNITDDNGDVHIHGHYFSDRGIAFHKPSSGRFSLRRYKPDPAYIPTNDEVAAFVKDHK